MSKKKSVKERGSRTAQYTCMCRASSYMEKDEMFRSDDYISVRLLPGFIKFLMKTGLLKMAGRYSPKGIYEYVIARTKYIDHIFLKAIGEGIEQILIPGAGYDSRGIRLLTADSSTRVFELDTHAVQDGKEKQFRKRGIVKPQNNIYIPTDFMKEDIRNKILTSGYSPEKKTLFILEGLIMYLSEKLVHDLFHRLHELSAPESLVVFDYIYASVLRLENKFYGENDCYRTVEKADERWIFGIEEGKVNEFLNKFGFQLIEHLDTHALEQKYFVNSEGKLIARVNGTHSIVLAERV